MSKLQSLARSLWAQIPARTGFLMVLGAGLFAAGLATEWFAVSRNSHVDPTYPVSSSNEHRRYMTRKEIFDYLNGGEPKEPPMPNPEDLRLDAKGIK
jgi:hypothetical protein